MIFLSWPGKVKKNCDFGKKPQPIAKNWIKNIKIHSKEEATSLRSRNKLTGNPATPSSLNGKKKTGIWS